MTNPQMGWLDRIVAVNWGAGVIGIVIAACNGTSPPTIMTYNSSVETNSHDLCDPTTSYTAQWPPLGVLKNYGSGDLDDSAPPFTFSWGFHAFVMSNYPKGVNMTVSSVLPLGFPPGYSQSMHACLLAAKDVKDIVLMPAAGVLTPAVNPDGGSTTGLYIQVNYKGGGKLIVPVNTEDLLNFKYTKEHMPVLPYGWDTADIHASGSCVQTVKLTQTTISVPSPGIGFPRDWQSSRP